MQKQESESVQIGVVESDDQSRQFMSAVIDGTPGLRVSFACSTGRDALWSFGRSQPSLFLVSLFLRDITGTELIQRIRGVWPGVLPILLIPENSPRLFMEALEAGASAYLLKPCSAEELVRTIRTVHEGGAVLSSPVAKALVDYFRARGLVFRLLTERERQVLKCMSRGFSKQVIATELGIDKATVRTHIKNILNKLDVHSSAEAIALYLNPKAPAPALELSVFRAPYERANSKVDYLPVPALRLRVH